MRGKYLKHFAHGSNVVVLQPEIQKAFPTSEAVNKALSLRGAEFSDGQLRFLCLLAALSSPRPAELLVLNEPETSIHPDLISALARLIRHAAEQTQVWVVSHSAALIAELERHPDCNRIRLEKELGATIIPDQGLLDTPQWNWPDKSE